MKNISFKDDFENGAAHWDFTNPARIGIKDSGDPAHGKVLSLRSGGAGVYALIKGSDNWSNIRVEGEVYFPFDSLHYMGLIYNYNVVGDRVDFGSIFFLGPFGDDFDTYYKNYQAYMTDPPENSAGNVILVNPHRDGNASRLLYTEYWVGLKGESRLKTGEWHRFKAEIMGPKCHFYVGDMKTPRVTFDYFEYSSGKVGFKPRFVGSECRLDNIEVASIGEFSYKGPGLPAGRLYKPERLITQWEVIGPFAKRMKEIEKEGFQPGKSYVYQNKPLKWKPFAADGRGCVVSCRVTKRFNGKFYSYFHTAIQSDSKKEVRLQFSTANNLEVWVDNVLKGEAARGFTVWHDFWYNPGHQGTGITVTLKPGLNHIVVLVKGGRYGGDGFYAYLGSNKDEK
ncbi:MAG: hypothetical protein GY950_00470 [bacterium]|nr:hypothetical protein [bacterium]